MVVSPVGFGVRGLHNNGKALLECEDVRVYSVFILNCLYVEWRGLVVVVV